MPRMSDAKLLSRFYVVRIAGGNAERRRSHPSRREQSGVGGRTRSRSSAQTGTDDPVESCSLMQPRRRVALYPRLDCPIRIVTQQITQTEVRVRVMTAYSAMLRRVCPAISILAGGLARSAELQILFFL